MNIAIVDSTTDIESFISKNKEFTKIISLDYESDTVLSSKNILHETSDDYFSDHELEVIQQKSYKFSKWYELDDISKLISYEDINLGELFYSEFHYFLIPFLKKFFELSKIIKINSSYEFYSSGMAYKIISQISKNSHELESISEKNNFVYDTIKKSFKLGNKEFSLNISRSNFKKIKNKSESILDKFFHIKKNIFYDVLLVEFDPIKYQNLFKTFPKLGMNGLFLGLRRPAIWNSKSFSIFKQSKCDIATLNYFLSDAEKNKIQKDKKIIDSCLKNLMSFSEFENFFSLNQISFWNLIKEYFFNLCKSRMHENLSNIVFTKQLLSESKIKTILLWSEQSATEKITLHFAKKFKIPVFLLQHGYYHDTKESFEYLDFMGNIPRNSSKIIVWGNVFKNYLTISNINKQKIISLGNPFYDEILSRKTKNLKNDYVLLATSGPVDNIINDLKINTRINYVETIKKICSVVEKNNKKLIIKLHPWQEEFFPSKIIKTIYPNVEIIKEKNILDLIENCSIFITIDTSTTILEAFSLDKPVISVSVKNYGWNVPSIFKNNYCLNVPQMEFSQIFEKVISNESYKKNLIVNGNYFLNDYLTNSGKSSKNILEYLKNYPNS